MNPGEIFIFQDKLKMLQNLAAWKITRLYVLRRLHESSFTPVYWIMNANW
jgi:hypothetical protein